MSPPPSIGSPIGRSGVANPDVSVRVLWVVFTTALVLRAGLAWGFPTIHGGDAAGRLAQADSLLLGYQLPVPQLFVVAAKAWRDDPLLVRLIFSGWGALLAAGGAALVHRVAGTRGALLGGVLLAFDPLLIHYSVVPYQEPVAYALLAWAFGLAPSRPQAAAALMALACLSRFEAWIFLPAFFAVVRSAPIGLMASLPVLGWVAWWRGLAPPGFYVLDLDPGADRLPRMAYLGGKLIEYEGSLVVLLALGSWLAAFRRPNPEILKASGVIAFVILVIVGLGHEYPAGSGLMSERMIHLPVILVLLLAATGLGSLASRSSRWFALCLLATLLLGARNLRFEIRLLQAAAADPDLALAREVARAVEQTRGAGECVTVRAAPVDPALLGVYVRKVESAGGDFDRARALARTLASASPDLDRVAAHLAAPPRTVRGEPGCPLLVVMDRLEERGDLPPHPPLRIIQAGPRQASLYRIRQ